MSYAKRLAARIRKVLEKQVQEKGYEVDVVLIKEALNDSSQLFLTATEEPENGKQPIKIIVTEFDQETWPMPLGDNAKEFLDFIRIETEETPDPEQVEESNFLEYAGAEFKVIAVAPTGLGGMLIIKECRAEKVV